MGAAAALERFRRWLECRGVEFRGWPPQLVRNPWSKLDFDLEGDVIRVRLRGNARMTPSSVDQASIDGLGQALSDHGWQVGTERNGTLLVYIAHAGGRTAVDNRAEEPEMPSRAAVAKEPEMRPLAERLAAAGWHAMRATDGSVVFATKRQYSA